MLSYKKLYLELHNSVLTALQELEQGNSAAAENLLKEALSSSEELLLKMLEEK